MTILTTAARAWAPPTTPAPATTATLPGGGTGPWQIPKITPDFSGPGIAGIASLGNWIAAIALVGAVIAIILGVLMAAIGPRLGFMHAKAMGMGGILGGIAVGGVVALATTAVNTVGGWFA